MSGSLRLDTREFQQAIREYVAATGKSGADSLNRAARNFAIKSITATKDSRGKGAILALQNEPWWPKLVARVMAKQAGGSAASKAYQAQWSKLASSSRKMTKEEKSYAKYAAQLSRRLLGSRTGALTFLRFFFRVLAKRMSEFSKGGPIPGGKAFPGFAVAIVPAQPKRLTVKMDNTYKFKRRGAGSAAGAEMLLQKAMTVALPATVADIKQYAADQLSKQAAKYSGKGSK